MTIELLYFDGCPSYAAFLPRLRALLRDAGVGERLELRRIETSEAADANQFLGSPTLRVDGIDIEPGAAHRDDFGLKCRLYRTETGLSPTPPDEWVLAALADRGAQPAELDGTRASTP